MDCFLNKLISERRVGLLLMTGRVRATERYEGDVSLANMLVGERLTRFVIFLAKSSSSELDERFCEGDFSSSNGFL